MAPLLLISSYHQHEERLGPLYLRYSMYCAIGNISNEIDAIFGI